MKKIYFIFAASIAVIPALAQPTLTGLQLNPVIGETITIAQGSFDDHQGNGSNQTWDFSNLSIAAQGSFTVIPSTAAYPGTNMGFDYGGGNVLYSIVDATQQAYKYQVVSGVTVSYTDPLKFIPLPLSSSTSSTDAFAGTLTNGGVDFVRSGSSSFAYVGFGTLTTPQGTFSNCLKLQLTQSYTDTYTDFGGGVIEYELTGYYWFKAGAHYPLLALISFSEDGFPTEYSQMFVSSSLGLEENVLDNSVVYPNPTSNELNISIPSTSEDISISIIDLNGQVVSKETVYSVNNEYSISVNNLDSGIYFAEIELKDGSISRKKFQKI